MPNVSEATSLILSELRSISERLTAIEERLKMRHPGVYSPEERRSRQLVFLEMYSDLWGVRESCRRAGISHETYYEWREKDTWFREQQQLCRNGQWVSPEPNHKEVKT